MALINRVAISNVLNYHGDSSHADWSPRFRYENLDFRGHSAAINLTNGGGKTTLAEAMIAVLSRDHSLVTNTKNKFSPMSGEVWSHVQVELIRPIGSAAQNDLLTQTGNSSNGEHWVFGVCGNRGKQSLSYYYFQGTLKDLPIGEEDGHRKILIQNDQFTKTRKSIKSLVWAPRESEWQDALTYKANLPQSTIRQLTDFQKRGGQDKSALLFNIKKRPGESYAEAFFYKVLAPAIMEGVMDREGEDGEVKLEDTVERAVLSTINAKRDTEECRQEAEQLSESVGHIGQIMNVAGSVEEHRELYEKELLKIRTDVQVLTYLVGKGNLPGIPKSNFPNGLVGELAQHLVLESGAMEASIKDRGLAILLDIESKHLNERAVRNSITTHEMTQVIDFTCDLFLQGKGTRGNKSKSYTLDNAKKLLNKSDKFGHNITKELAIELIEDAFSWFDNHGDSNPYRFYLFNLKEDIKRFRKEEHDLEKRVENLENERRTLISQQQKMESNEGMYNSLVESGLFIADELKQPLVTGEKVAKSREAASKLMVEFEINEAGLKEHIDSWTSFTRQFGQDAVPEIEINTKENEKSKLTKCKSQIKLELESLKSKLKIEQGKVQGLSEEKNIYSNNLERLIELRDDYQYFFERFGDVSPIDKGRELIKELTDTNNEITKIEEQTKIFQAGVNSLSKFNDDVSSKHTPAEWLISASIRKSEIAVENSDIEKTLTELKDQREILEKDPVAYNTTTKQALKRLSEKSLHFKPLYAVISDLKLESERKKKVFAIFSAMLFSPVFDEEEDTLSAAEALSDIDVQIPVFLRQTIVDYCKNAKIKSFVDNKLYIGTSAGIVTRPVQCILDPNFVTREKERIERKITTLSTAIEKNHSELVALSDDSEQVIIARRAKSAIDENEVDKLNKAEELLTKLFQVVAELEPDCTDASTEIIAKAERYIKLGGVEQDESLIKKIEKLQSKLELLSGLIEELNQNIEDKDGEYFEIDKKLQKILPAKLLSLLNSAKAFYEKDGPAFIATAKDERKRLSTSLAISEERFGYYKYFEGAQCYINSLNSGDSSQESKNRLAELSREIEEKKSSKINIRKIHESKSESVPEIKSLLESIDKMVVVALKKYRKVALISTDAASSSNLEIENHPLVELSNDLSFLLHEKSHVDQIKQCTYKIDDLLDSFDIERKADDLRRSKNGLMKIETQFVDKAKQVAEISKGLAPVEKTILSRVESAKEISNVRNLYEGLLDQYNKTTELLQQCDSAERESRRGVTSRLSHLIDFATLDLSILRNVAKAKRSKHVAYFNVDANILDQEGIKSLIDTIITEVDVLEEQRREREKKGISSPADNQYRETLRETIRNKLYKNIFLNPTITYVNETIRASGEKNEFNEKSLSEGQKAAMSLMWTIRLAEFAIVREAKRLSSRRAQNKAMEVTENIILVDGLFSNLSDRDLIDSAMAGIEGTRGRFQLIGLIHNPHYQNDYSKFPVLIIGKSEGNADKPKGWVKFYQGNVVDWEKTPSLRTAQIVRMPTKSSMQKITEEETE